MLCCPVVFITEWLPKTSQEFGEVALELTPARFWELAFVRSALSKNIERMLELAIECDENHNIAAMRTGAAGFCSLPRSIADPFRRS
jgi:hypothetical protein